MKKALPILLVVVGLVIFVIGFALPNRLPRDERNMGTETICMLISAGFVYGGAYVDRKQQR